MNDQWTYRQDRIIETFELISPAGRCVGEVYDESDARSLVELLNDGLKARQAMKDDSDAG